MAKKTVGKSGVTPCKHFIHDKLIGMINGVTATRSVISGMRYYDLTAGDGCPALGDSFRHDCSPGIYLHHVTWWAKTHGYKPDYAPVELVLVEKQAATYAQLLLNTGKYLAEQGWTQTSPSSWCLNTTTIHALRQDASRLAPPLVPPEQGVHIYCDPNNIDNWVLTPEFLGACPKFTTSLTTLGCNPSGLKRIATEKREQWFERTNQLVRALVEQWHDACLFSVGGCDQWAYLITAPTAWRSRITKVCLEAATQIQGRTAKPQVVWARQSPQAYRELQEYLFLTHKERSEAA